MADFIRTQAYANWIDSLKDIKGRGRIGAKLRTFEITGHPGDAKSIGEGLYEMRFDFGPGYRVYYVVLKKTVILMGGDKSTQVADIRKAKEYAEFWRGQKL